MGQICQAYEQLKNIPKEVNILEGSLKDLENGKVNLEITAQSINSRVEEIKINSNQKIRDIEKIIEGKMKIIDKKLKDRYYRVFKKDYSE